MSISTAPRRMEEAPRRTVSGVRPAERANGARCEQRTQLFLQIEIEHEEITYIGFCQNLSLGGMFIETTMDPPPFGATILLTVPLGGVLAFVEATVRWAGEGGIGVQFGLMGARETHALMELIEGR